MIHLRQQIVGQVRRIHGDARQAVLEDREEEDGREERRFEAMRDVPEHSPNLQAHPPGSHS